MLSQLRLHVLRCTILFEHAWGEARSSGSFLTDGQGSAKSGVDRVFFHMHAQVFIEIRAGSCTLLV